MAIYSNVKFLYTLKLFMCNLQLSALAKKQSYFCLFTYFHAISDNIEILKGSLNSCFKTDLSNMPSITRTTFLKDTHIILS